MLYQKSIAIVSWGRRSHGGTVIFIAGGKIEMLEIWKFSLRQKNYMT